MYRRAFYHGKEGKMCLCSLLMGRVAACLVLLVFGLFDNNVSLDFAVQTNIYPTSICVYQVLYVSETLISKEFCLIVNPNLKKSN